LIVPASVGRHGENDHSDQQAGEKARGHELPLWVEGSWLWQPHGYNRVVATTTRFLGRLRGLWVSPILIVVGSSKHILRDRTKAGVAFATFLMPVQARRFAGA
jgi:hypothetical protein